MRINDLEMAYADCGKGEAILLLHGLALEGRIWRPMIEAYESQVRFIAPDLRGHGMSSVGEADGSLLQIAEDVKALLDALGIEKVCMLGHSMGGYIALAFAKAYPERLDSLVLLTSNVRADSPEKRAARLREAEDPSPHGMAVFAQSLAKRLSSDPTLAEQLEDQMRQMKPRGLANILKAIAMRPSQEELVSNLEIPVLAIAGAEDKISSPAVALEAAWLAKHGHQLILPKAGHMPMLEAPHALGAAIIAFMECKYEPET
ncbi:MAG: alpha/beta hydrolase [Anaerolineaceae bacterium]|nr:alpha/beta hydrolase [Anaerolineaceae bacterium]